jgi:hypothetical protein
MGTRIISLTDYRQQRPADARQTRKGASLRRRLKNASPPRPMKTRQRLVGSHVDPAQAVAVDAVLSRTNTAPRRWDNRFILTAAFFLGCLVMVALGL